MDQATFRKMKFLFEPVDSIERLDEWCQYFLDVSFPWDTVDPDSTSSPLKAMWDVYQFMLTGKGQSTHIVAACRNGFKTLISSGIHCYSMLQFRRDDAHTAATLNQSSAATRYLNQFYGKIGQKVDMTPYITVSNFRTLELHNLPATDFATKSTARSKIVTATLKGANSDRASCFAGKTKIPMWPSDQEWASAKGSYSAGTGRINYITMDGLWQRMQRGEEIYTMAVNPKTTVIERKKILAIQRSLEPERLVIETVSGKVVETTASHPFATEWDGKKFVFTNASNLQIGGEVILNKSSILGRIDIQDHIHNPYPEPNVDFIDNFSLSEMLDGSLLGDGCLVKKKKRHPGQPGKTNASFVMTKTPMVREYSIWLSQKLNSELGFCAFSGDQGISGYTGKPLDKIRTRNSEVLTHYYNRWYYNGKKTVPRDIKLTMPMLAVWFMDDGSATNLIATYSFSKDDCLFLCNEINKLMGFDCAWCADIVRASGGETRTYHEIRLNFPFKHKQKYFELASYIHPAYRYKIKINTKECLVCKKRFVFEGVRNVCNNSMCVFKTKQKNITTDIIKSITPKTASSTKRERWVYDIQVEDYHNFFANGFLVHNCLIFDELDLTPQSIVDEAVWVADPSIPRNDGFQIPAAFIYLSSRKSNSGPVQRIMDRALKSPQDDKLHKWSTSDMMRSCPPEVHKPEQPRIMAYVNTTNLETIWGDETFLKSVPEVSRTEWKQIHAYEGCKTCPVWIPCLSNSVVQKDAENPLLRTREFIHGTHRNVSDSSYIIGQSLNWKPESKGLVFQQFSQMHHVKPALSFYEWAVKKPYLPFGVSQEEYDTLVESAESITALNMLMPSKEICFRAMVDAGWIFNIGVDWGSSDPAAAHIVGYHSRWKMACTLHYEQTPMANHLWAQYIENNITTVFPPNLICPDGADASSASYFKKHSCFTEKFHIEPGVSFIRGLLWNPIKGTRDYAIYDDSTTNGENNNMHVVHSMEHWSHVRKPDGTIDMSRFMDDDNCHALDSMRYALAPFIKDVKVTFSTSQGIIPDLTVRPTMTEAEIQAVREKQRLENHLRDHIQQIAGVDMKDTKTEEKTKKQGQIKFKF